MKDARDPGTIDMTLPPKRRRGRPSTGKAKSAAERMREYRARSVTVNRGVLESALSQAGQVDAVAFQVDAIDQVSDELWQARRDVSLLRDQLDRVRYELADAGRLAHHLTYDVPATLGEEAEGYLASLLGAVECALSRLAVDVTS